MSTFVKNIKGLFKNYVQKGEGKKTAKKRDGKENSVMVGGKVSEKSAKNVTVTKKA